jgi:hypothetical protein
MTPIVSGIPVLDSNPQSIRQFRRLATVNDELVVAEMCVDAQISAATSIAFHMPSL